jgi:hypothetical protein
MAIHTIYDQFHEFMLESGISLHLICDNEHSDQFVMDFDIF